MAKLEDFTALCRCGNDTSSIDQIRGLVIDCLRTAELQSHAITDADVQFEQLDYFLRVCGIPDEHFISGLDPSVGVMMRSFENTKDGVSRGMVFVTVRREERRAVSLSDVEYFVRLPNESPFALKKQIYDSIPAIIHGVHEYLRR